MPSPALFGISVALSFVVWGIIAQQYLWPALRLRPRADALKPILLLHAFRFIGLAFLIPGVVSPSLPLEFARPAAYGDLAAAILALLAFATLRSSVGTILTWIFGIVGSLDLLNAFWQGNRISLPAAPGLQGAAYFLTTVIVPLLLITHVLVFRLLLGTQVGFETHARQQAA